MPKQNLDAYSSLKRQLLAKSLLYKLFSKLSPEPQADPILPSRDQLNILQENPCASLGTSLGGSRT